MIETLSKESGWAMLHACLALEKIGTAAAIPELDRIVKSNEYFGALSIKDS